jgi:hypothetical protein
MTTRRARVTFHKSHQPIINGQPLARVEGDLDDTTGILWNAKKADGVRAHDPSAPVGIHIATGHLIQFVPEAAPVDPNAPKVYLDANGKPMDPPSEDAEPVQGEVYLPPARGRSVLPPVTEAAKRAAAKLAEQRAAAK